MADPTPSIDELLTLADQCVKCGLCLPHCPTYDKTRNEADSPRGRISLIQGWLTGALPLSDTLVGHLDGCLVCRACETVCPSLVAYGRLADGAKARRMLEVDARKSALRRLRLSMMSNAAAGRLLTRGAMLFRWSGLHGLARLAGADRASKLRPYLHLMRGLGRSGPIRTTTPPANPDADLFLGCTGANLQGDAVGAAIKVCERLGIGLRLPSDNECCGALLKHSGYPAEAEARRAESARSHADRPLVGLASACAAELKEDARFASVQELCAFLDAAAWPETVTLRPLPKRVLVHEPCSHRNLLGGNAAVHRLLDRIPGIDLRPLPGNDRCCGAAGDYLLRQPEMAQTLALDKIEAVRLLAPDIVVTTNPGCLIHLRASLEEAGLQVEICHPVELVARQL